MNRLHNLINMKKDSKDMVCLVGAGGKTSTMFRLAGELSSEGKRVLVTTTTAICRPERNLYDNMLISEVETIDLFDKTSSGGITVLGRSLSPEGKLLGVNPRFLDAVYNEGLFDYILAEGDGSKGRPLKAPAEHEPVIPLCATKVLGIIGLDAIGKKVCHENIHRPEIFCGILGCREGDIVDTEMVSSLIAHESGLFKAAPAHAEKYLIMNKAEIENGKTAAYDIAEKLLNKNYEIAGIIISSMKASSFRNAEKEVSGIILAAGLSRRMGVDKLLLPVGGIPAIERVIAAASKARLKELILVCGSDIAASIGRRYGAKIVNNNEPELGQSHSVRLGVENSERFAEGFMFLMGDQPFIDESIINALILSFSKGCFSAAVPFYNDIRGNPVIFDSSLRDKLLSLSGDSGGRVLLKELNESIVDVDFDCEKPGLDMDTRDEYDNIIKLMDDNE